MSYASDTLCLRSLTHFVSRFVQVEVRCVDCQTVSHVSNTLCSTPLTHASDTLCLTPLTRCVSRFVQVEAEDSSGGDMGGERWKKVLAVFVGAVIAYWFIDDFDPGICFSLVLLVLVCTCLLFLVLFYTSFFRCIIISMHTWMCG